MHMCPRCLSLNGKPVDIEPHSNLGDKQIMMEDRGRVELYTCLVCHTRWRRKVPTQGITQRYHWTVD